MNGDEPRTFGDDIDWVDIWGDGQWHSVVLCVDDGVVRTFVDGNLVNPTDRDAE